MYVYGCTMSKRKEKEKGYSSYRKLERWYYYFPQGQRLTRQDEVSCTDGTRSTVDLVIVGVVSYPLCGYVRAYHE